MSTKQQTLKEKVSLKGIGLHTGIETEITICPAPTNHWFVFKRIDLANKPLILADVAYVIETNRGIVLEKDGAKIHTPEHLLSALVGLGIDNALIEVNGPEVPILDGSALPFVEAIVNAGIVEQNANKNFFIIDEAIQYHNEDKSIEIAALPLNDYRVTVMVDYKSCFLSSQHAKLHDISFYKESIAPCRTFVFAHEIEHLYKDGLVKGGNAENAVIIAENDMSPAQVDFFNTTFNLNYTAIKSGILNEVPLKFPNEPARHKLLDVMGDLALVGRPLKAHILAARPGHESNIALAKLIKKKISESDVIAPTYDANEPPVFTINDIAKLLPHRYPFQLVDKIVSLDGTTVVGIKNVTMNEPQFTGHFPENPVFPGVLQLEAIAQTGGVLVLTTTDEPTNYWPYLVGIDNCRFLRNVLPGDTLVIKCTLLAPIRMGVAKMHGEAWVGKNKVCSVDMTARLVKKQ